ncbi:Nif3-like dinuclear metal center hexameric protein, partial [Streptococcus suis]
MQRREFNHLLNTILRPDAIQDFCPNGLQVEGREQVKKIVTGVTASQALIDAAIAHNADTILVHH